ncbi:MAG: FecR domain-containing protein [Deltaproteobacteria bacterium]|nr:FecR domain-containing protein [Deltaproteobacteria bacterium]
MNRVPIQRPEALERVMPELDDRVPAGARARVWARLEAERSSSPVSTSPWTLASVAATAAIVFALWPRSLQPEGSAELIESSGQVELDGLEARPGVVLASGTALRARDGTATLRLRDGSRMSVSANTELAPVTVVDGTRVVLKHGGVALRVAHQAPGRTLVVEASPYEARVVGTVFEVLRDRGVVEVHVTEGTVEVKGPNALRRLEAGESFRSDEVMSADAGRSEFPSATPSDWRRDRSQSDPRAGSLRSPPLVAPSGPDSQRSPERPRPTVDTPLTATPRAPAEPPGPRSRDRINATPERREGGALERESAPGRPLIAEEPPAGLETAEIHPTALTKEPGGPRGPGSSALTETAEELYDRALRETDVSTSVALFDRVADLSGRSSLGELAQQRAAARLLEGGEPRVAQGRLRALIASHPDGSLVKEAWISLLEADLEANDLEAARADVERARTVLGRERAAELSRLEGELLRRSNECPRAVSAFERSITVAPSEEARFGLAACLAELRDPRAKAALEAYLAAHPNGRHHRAARRALEKLSAR